MQEYDVSEQMLKMDNLTEEELILLESKYKEKYLPTYRKVLLIPYHFFVSGFLYYYMKNFKKISPKMFKPKKYNLWEITKYGTIQAFVFVNLYVLGFCSVSGVWHPIQFTRDLAKIKGKSIDNYIRFDDNIQEYVLFSIMKYFGVNNDTIDKAKSDLNQQKKELEDNKFFSEKFAEELKRKSHSIFTKKDIKNDND